MSQACSYYAQPGHVNEQLKEQLKSQKEGNRNCLLKISQSKSPLSRGKQDKESNFKQLLLPRTEHDEVFRKGTEIL